MVNFLLAQLIKNPIYAYKSLKESKKIKYQLRRVDCYNGETIKTASEGKTEIMFMDVLKGNPGLFVDSEYNCLCSL